MRVVGNPVTVDVSAAAIVIRRGRDIAHANWIGKEVIAECEAVVSAGPFHRTPVEIDRSRRARGSGMANRFADT